MGRQDPAEGLASLSLHESGSDYLTSGSHVNTSGSHSSMREKCGPAPEAAAKAQQAKETFGELLAVMSPMQLLAGDDPDAEAEHWSIFADVFEREVQHQEQKEGKELQIDQRRQILADILVWAEVTQSQYDHDTATFVLEPHEQDPSFRRIGDMLKAAKAERGLGR